MMGPMLLLPLLLLLGLLGVAGDSVVARDSVGAGDSGVAGDSNVAGDSVVVGYAPARVTGKSVLHSSEGCRSRGQSWPVCEQNSRWQQPVKQLCVFT